MKTKYKLFLLTALLLNGCSNERIKLLNQVEDVLPGNWEIESVRLPRYGLGVTYQGNTFIADTILYNVGSIQISEFSADSLHFQDRNHGKVRCTLSIDNESFPYSINSMDLSGDDIFAQWGYNGPHGTFPIVTHAERFLWSSYIFNNNYFIFIQNNDHIELAKANAYTTHVITLKRI